jgi:hypothetical protein
MVSLSAGGAEAWCQAHGYGLDESGRPCSSLRAQRFEIPQDTGRRIAIVAGHLQRFASETETLVWFTEWGVWPSCERPHIFDRFRASYGETRSLVQVPAHLFASSEREDALSFMTLGVLFLWDVYAAGASGTRLVHYSHDEVGWVVE